jgi:hypothetical protein
MRFGAKEASNRLLTAEQIVDADSTPHNVLHGILTIRAALRENVLPPTTHKKLSSSMLPRVSAIFGLDPSPVTGWYSVPKKLRELNADRIAN